MTNLNHQTLLEEYKYNILLIHALEKRVSISNPLLQYLYKTTWHPKEVEDLNNRFDELLIKDMLANA